MKNLNFQLLVLLILIMGINIFPQTKTVNNDTSLKEKFTADTLEIKNKNVEKLSNIFLAPLLYNFNPETLHRIGNQSLKLFLTDEMYEHNIEEIKYGNFINRRGITAQYLFLVQQKKDLFTGLQKINPKESPEMEFIRKYLGVSKSIAAIIIMLIHLSKNLNSPFP